MSLSIWSGSAFRDVANFLNLSDRVLVKQGCDEYSFTWGISEKVHETTVGKREGLGAFWFFFKQLGKERLFGLLGHIDTETVIW